MLNMNLVIVAILLIQHLVEGVQVVWDNNIDLESVNEQEVDEGRAVRMPNEFLIYPGTKWCGAGDIAQDENDLGKFKETDKCCRSHDFCPDVIEGGETKYNLTNPSFYSRLSCKCDEEFRQCLKRVGTRPSMQVGYIYFTGLGTQCFKKEHPIKGCKAYSYVGWKKCKEYELDQSQPPVYQWFDVPNF